MRNSSLVIAVLGVIILGALFFIFKSNKAGINTLPSTSPSASIEESTSSATPSANAANAKVFNIVVKNNKLVSGPDTIQVTQGDKVTIRITADVDGELHLHGYNIPVDFKKDQPTDLTVVANITGRFPYELEDTKTEIGALEVLPK